MTKRLSGAVLLVLVAATLGEAQQGLGGLRGVITDDQGAVLPGVTVTITSPSMLGPQVDVTNAGGEYRVINLPPGTFTLTAELTGFANSRREGILLRAGATFQVDLTMQLSTLQETITVRGDSPMIEVDKASNVLNIDGEFQRLMPIQARRNYSDFLELTPGVISRGFDDGSGRQVYFGHATEHFAHVLQLEGTIASNYHDAQLTYVSMGADMVADTQVKTGGIDAAEPMGVGLVMNIITKSGGNDFRGSVAGGYQPYNWNGNNIDNCTSAPGCKPGRGGTPTTAYVRQFDGALGGPIMRDKAWFFAALRRGLSSSGISRTASEVARIQEFKPGAPLFDNDSESWQPFVKVTTRVGRHDLQAFYQRDRLLLTGNREYNYEEIAAQSTGGPLYAAKATSVWGNSVTTSVTASYNGKGGSDASTFQALGLSGPQIIIHNSAFASGATMQGEGRILEGGNLQSYAYQPASQVIIRADLTYFKDGWFGNHQFQTGIFAAPRNRYDQETNYVNGGFVLEEQRLRVPGDVASGTIPFRRRYFEPTSLTTRQAQDRDIGIYVQDSWRPTGRLSLNLGVRADFVRRYDNVFKIERQNSLEIGPRFGFSYQLTKDARTILRGSAVRVHEQVMGRDAITTFGADSAAAERNEYDFDGDGRFETVIANPARTSTLADYEFADGLNQPFVDEFILGLRRQFPLQLSLDVAGIWRSYQDNWARVDVNGIYPSGPNQPFGGFGLVDPTRGVVFQQQNNKWSTLEYRAIEVTVAKNMSHNFQLMAGINRQWQHFGGTWNPTDPGPVHPAGHLPEQHAHLHAARQQRREQPADCHRHHGPHLRADVAEVLDALRRHLHPAVERDPRRQLHDPGRAVVWPDRHAAAGRRSAARGVRSDHRAPAKRHLAEQSAVDAHALRQPDARRGPGAGAGHQDARHHAQQGGQARRLAGSRGRRLDLQRAQRRQLLAVQLQRRQRGVQHRELPAVPQPAGRAGGAGDAARAVLRTGCGRAWVARPVALTRVGRPTAPSTRA